MIERQEAVKRLKAALLKRTGKKWNVAGDRGTAWGWLNITAPKERRKWDLKDTGKKDGQGFPIYEDVPCDGEFGYMGKEDRETLGAIFNRDGKPAHCQGISISPDAREWYVAMAEETEGEELERTFAEAAPSFQYMVTETASEHGKTWQQVWEWWREYALACQDQSAIWTEFLSWYAEKLGPKVNVKPLPTLLEVAKTLLEICRVKCGPNDEVILPDGKTNHEALIEAVKVIEGVTECKVTRLVS